MSNNQNILAGLNPVKDFLEMMDNESAEAIDNITDTWKAARLTMFTSSKIDVLNSKGRAKGAEFSDMAISYIYAKAGEAMTLEANEASSAAITWGNEHEPFAFKELERVTGKEIEYYGKMNPVFIKHDDYSGGSPDGWIDAEKATVEVKCPYESGNHARVLHEIKKGIFDLHKYKKEYYGQIQFNMFLQKAAYGYFVSYDPRTIDTTLTLAIAKIERDEKYIKSLLERIALAATVKREYLIDMGVLKP